LNILKWLKENVCWIEDHSVLKAAQGGHIALLKWFRKGESGCQWKEFQWSDSQICGSAANGGHLEVLKWLRENGCEFDVYTCNQAAEQHHFDVLKWLIKNGCGFDPHTCAMAAKGSHLEMLKLLRKEHQCPWDDNIFFAAVQNGDMTIL